MGTLYTLRSGGSAHPEDSVLQFFTDYIIQPGVKDLNTTDNHFKVTENSPTGMSVLVNTGRALVQRGSSNLYPVRHTGSPSVVSIDNNVSGNPRIDAIVLYINLAASPNSDSSNVATLTKVNGTPAASPNPPSDSDIATAIGASNPFIRLANVTVANGAAQILNANISDQRVPFKVRGSLKSGTATDQSTTTYDISQYNYISHTLGGNRTLQVINDKTDDVFVVKLIQDSTGNRTVTWWSGIDWFGGTPILTTTPNRADVFGFVKKADGRYDGYVIGQNATIS